MEKNNNPFSTFYDGWLIFGTKDTVDAKIKEMKKNASKEDEITGYKGRVNAGSRAVREASQTVMDYDSLNEYCKNLVANVLKEL